MEWDRFHIVPEPGRLLSNFSTDLGTSNIVSELKLSARCSISIRWQKHIQNICEGNKNRRVLFPVYNVNLFSILDSHKSFLLTFCLNAQPNLFLWKQRNSVEHNNRECLEYLELFCWSLCPSCEGQKIKLTPQLFTLILGSRHEVSYDPEHFLPASRVFCSQFISILLENGQKNP